ncbi:MAG: FxsA family protein [Campylobacter sputorum]|uniref:FxsA family protein n=1 Tax=Campylobacter sputorum TaxID=206 RepID=UPI000B78D8B4|nr:FxsA family protein [Campylobacter sputorum]ASM38343.1 putative membrane protein, FxsA family [Campylobacter sputorum bv. paraureolyticus LMG 11764]MDY6119743.1 FxsA family protein [Campylobacter sputorum]
MQKTLAFIYIFIEIFIIYAFIDEYGFLKFLLEIIISAVIGLMLMFKFGFINMANLSSPMQMISNFGISIGGFLLMLPGLMCDIVGLCVIIFSVFANKKIDKNYNFKKGNTNEDIIDVEVIDEDKK